MKKFNPSVFRSSAKKFLLPLFLLILAAACRKNLDKSALRDFSQTNLVANNGAYGAPNQDTGLKNAWGIAWAPSGIAWVNSHDGHVSALYNSEGVAVRAAVNIPSPTDTVGGEPTGIVFNGSSDFVLTNGQAARFIFVGEDGVLSGWNGPAGNNAIRIQDNSADAAYTGLALDSTGGAHYLYAANLKKGTIDVWDKNFMPVTWMAFSDPGIPSDYGPFNIQPLGDWLFVNYTKKGADGDEEVGAGNGITDIFTPDGKFVRRFASHGWLNAPWGIAWAPAGFFEDNDGDNDDSNSGNKHDDHKGDRNKNQPSILIGNFGDGKINAYSVDGQWLGQLRSHGHTIVIPGLWALSFPPASATAIDPNRLYFAAGPADEADGLFGYLIKQ